MKDDNILNLINLIPKWVWHWGLSPHGWTWWYLLMIIVLVVATCWVLYLIYDNIWYILFPILSWPMISTQYPCFVLTPTFMFSSCLFVECSKRAFILDSTVIQASLTTSEIQGELMLLAWTGSSSSSLDALNFRHGLASYVLLAFRILLV